MSSATSIKRAAGSAEPQAAAEPAIAQKDGFGPWHFFVLASLLGATVAVVLAKQASPEQLVLLSFTVAAAGACAAALYATLVPLVRKDSGVGRTSLSGRSRAALEREKMLVLRSIKELEFDRAMGKVSGADFDEMAGRLRARAIALMKQLDADVPAYRALIEKEIAARIDRAPVSRPTCGCGTANDPDAAFCKRCGTRLQREP